MMRIIFIAILFMNGLLYGQTKSAQDYGFKHLVLRFNADPVDILVKSKTNEEDIPKPLFFFCQGSLPIPMIVHEGATSYGTFPFNPDSLSKDYHLVIVGKPSIPLIADVTELQSDYTYLDSTGRFPKGYITRNLLSYYVPRNIAVVRFLQKQGWVSKDRLVVAGHSEGSTIAVKMAAALKDVTHLIYSGGNPLGRILSIVQQSRSHESTPDSVTHGEASFDYWEDVVAHHSDLTDLNGDTHRSTYEFSEPMMPYLQRLSIPVCVSYGTKDWGAPYNDYLRVDVIRRNKRNFTFRAYIGTEHNYFPIREDGTPDYNVFNWDSVADDWLRWLRRN
ncbi:MAG: alpha/beta hydrolase [Candidatus Kapabacteria bacterium]|nr:alpha/beta hydrolase [Candidatus Kapabacteria bacterium]